MSTKTDRLKPRLIVFTGDGKGKSTAAFGMGLRAWAQDWRVGVYQFVKSGKWKTGEQKAYEKLGIEWQAMGEGFTWLRANQDIDHAELARNGWQYVKELLAAQAKDFYILDEFNHVLNKGWVQVSEVVDVLTHRPGVQHVVITGRYAPAELIDAADLVTEMKKVKHPFDQGERGQAGIEW